MTPETVAKAINRFAASARKSQPAPKPAKKTEPMDRPLSRFALGKLFISIFLFVSSPGVVPAVFARKVTRVRAF
jgi:hypothetical protein